MTDVYSVEEIGYCYESMLERSGKRPRIKLAENQNTIASPGIEELSPGLSSNADGLTAELTREAPKKGNAGPAE